jgi:hypothetical protein
MNEPAPYQLDQTVDMLVPTCGCFVGIFDLTSAAHQAERYESGWRQAKAQVEAAGRGWATSYFIRQFVDRARLGQILAWELLFDGNFSVRIQVLAPDQELLLSRQLTEGFLRHEAHDLECSSGKIAVGSLGRLGDADLRPALEVPQGLYRVGVKLIETAYPNEGRERPDWLIWMKKIAHKST